MKHTNLTLAMLFTLCVFGAASAQQPARQCTVGVESAPALRGMRLGMTLEQAKSRLPGLQIKLDHFGLTTAWLDHSVAGEARPASLEGVQNLRLEFVDERVTRIQITYSNSINWQSDEQFTARVSAALKLPDAWEGASMRCDGFGIIATNNYINLSALRPYQILRQRRDEYEEKERQSFQP